MECCWCPFLARSDLWFFSIVPIMEKSLRNNESSASVSAGIPRPIAWALKRCSLLCVSAAGWQSPEWPRSNIPFDPRNDRKQAILVFDTIRMNNRDCDGLTNHQAGYLGLPWACENSWTCEVGHHKMGSFLPFAVQPDPDQCRTGADRAWLFGWYLRSFSCLLRLISKKAGVPWWLICGKWGNSINKPHLPCKIQAALHSNILIILNVATLCVKTTWWGKRSIRAEVMDVAFSSNGSRCAL